MGNRSRRTVEVVGFRRFQQAYIKGHDMDSAPFSLINWSNSLYVSLTYICKKHYGLFSSYPVARGAVGLEAVHSWFNLTSLPIHSNLCSLRPIIHHQNISFTYCDNFFLSGRFDTWPSVPQSQTKTRSASFVGLLLQFWAPLIFSYIMRESMGSCLFFGKCGKRSYNRITFWGGRLRHALRGSFFIFVVPSFNPDHWPSRVLYYPVCCVFSPTTQT